MVFQFQHWYMCMLFFVFREYWRGLSHKFLRTRNVWNGLIQEWLLSNDYSVSYFLTTTPLTKIWNNIMHLSSPLIWWATISWPNIWIVGWIAVKGNKNALALSDSSGSGASSLPLALPNRPDVVRPLSQNPGFRAKFWMSIGLSLFVKHRQQ